MIFKNGLMSKETFIADSDLEDWDPPEPQKEEKHHHHAFSLTSTHAPW